MEICDEHRKLNWPKFVENYRQDSLQLREVGLWGMASTLGEIIGLECVKNERYYDFKLHTEFGVFPAGGFVESGTFSVKLEEGLDIRYTDVRLVAVFGLLGEHRYNRKTRKHFFGSRHVPGDVGIVDGVRKDWIDVQSIDNVEAWSIVEALGLPANLDYFEHFCRDYAWIGSDGRVVKEVWRIAECERRLMPMYFTSMTKGRHLQMDRQYELRCSHVGCFATHMMCSLLKLSRLGIDMGNGTVITGSSRCTNEETSDAD